ncbi:MAG: DUF4198 domain-containing protein [Pseudomonadota bacterium]
MIRTLFTTACLACISLPAKAHEFWIDPVSHMVAPGDRIEADIRVGEAYEGTAFGYIPRRFRRFDTASQGRVSPVNGTVGDRPALSMQAEEDGLLVAIHATEDQHITWSEWGKFVSFLEHKDLTWGLAEHAARGLSEENVRERYSRYAKSLIAVGAGEGEDVIAGLETEIVALENPYTDDMSDGLDIRALYQGAPLDDVQIEVFRKAPDGTVTITTERTDAAGEVTIPIDPGARYMLDTVVLRPLEQTEEGDPAWETLWANLTFEVPLP